MFANRIRKNSKRLGPWLKQHDISCYRLYDRDLPEYAVAVDIYADHVHVQEYAAPDTVSAAKAETRLFEILALLPQLLAVPQQNVHLKVRRRQKGKDQYRPLATEQRFKRVEESGLWFFINLTDHLDSGLFLDHRDTRRLIRRQAEGKRFLNLFCYTGAATVYAANGGALETTSVDLSKQYLQWAERNLQENRLLGDNHTFIRADCMAWLNEHKRHYDLIFLDPPTFSNSKRVEGTLDIQRDHVELIRQSMQRLTPDGEIIFSTNFRKFKLDREALTGVQIENLSAITLPRDFARNPRIHQCWRISATGRDTPTPKKAKAPEQENVWLRSRRSG